MQIVKIWLKKKDTLLVETPLVVVLNNGVSIAEAQTLVQKAADNSEVKILAIKDALNTIGQVFLLDTMIIHE